LIGAVGALFAGFTEVLASAFGVGPVAAMQTMFLLYGLLGVLSGLIYRKLPPELETETAAPAEPLRQSKRIVYTLAALFSLDNGQVLYSHKMEEFL